MPLQVTDAPNNQVATQAGEQFILDEIEKNKEIRTEYTYSILSFLYNLEPYNVHVPGFEKSLISITEAMELFVLAHEYAHMSRKHSIDMEDELSVFDEDDALIIRNIFSWRNEIEADSIGNVVLQDVLNQGIFGEKNGLELLQRHGAVLYFTSLDNLEKAEQIIEIGKPQPLIKHDEIILIK